METQTEIQSAHVEVQTTPVSVRPQTTLVSVETQTTEVRDEMEDRRQREKEKEKEVSPFYPWDHMCRAARETEEQPRKLLPLYETHMLLLPISLVPYRTGLTVKQYYA